MAKKISLLIYGLSIIDENNNRMLLDDIYEQKSLIDIFENYIQTNKEAYSKDCLKETLFQFSNIEKITIKNQAGQEECNILCGIVKTGEYGIESELVDVNTGTVTNRMPSQADMMPFGFCIAVPVGKVNSAIAIFQTMGVYGMKVSLQKKLQQCLSSISPNWYMMLSSITPKEYVDKYFEKGILQKIRMTKYEIPEDVSNRVGINYGVKQTKEERIIHKPAGFMEKNKRKLKEWRNGQRTYSQIVEIDGFDYDELRLEFSLDGSNKTFNLKDMEKIVLSEDISKDVTCSGGHPTFSSLKGVMVERAKHYLQSMGLL